MNVCIISNPGVLGGEVDSDDMEGKSIQEKASMSKGSLKFILPKGKHYRANWGPQKVIIMTLHVLLLCLLHILTGSRDTPKSHREVRVGLHSHKHTERS